MKKLQGLLLCTLMVSILAPSAFAIAQSCVPYPPSMSYQQFKPDVQIKEADNGEGEATILVPFKNEDMSWWEFWKPVYVYKEAKMPTADLPKQVNPWWQFW